MTEEYNIAPQRRGFVVNPPQRDEATDEFIGESEVYINEPFAQEEEEETEELSVEEILSVAGAAEKIADSAQQLDMMKQIAAVGKLELYYNTVIDGGIYKDTLTIEGGTIEDNFSGLRNLTQDSVHRSIVRSQYGD